MNSISPVFTESEVFTERVIALGQEEYYPVIAARIRYSDDSIASAVRYRFTDEERALIIAGADLIISQPHHGPLMPLGLQLAMPSQYPEPQ